MFRAWLYALARTRKANTIPPLCVARLVKAGTSTLAVKAQYVLKGALLVAS